MDLKKYLSDRSEVVNKALRKYLPKDNSIISRAMRYSIFAGGKRLRPILVLEASDLCGMRVQDALPAACALEFIHTYSLIHDDLPAMDNDDLRRGKPSSHKKFGEAAAILAGDALVTDAFMVICECAKNKKIDCGSIINAIAILSDAAGSRGMILGQVKDTIESAGWNKRHGASLEREVLTIHLNKTAALIKASLMIGAALASASKKQMEALKIYGENIGIAFQIADDILDITADKKLLGKKGSDKDNNKLTYPAIYGLHDSMQIASALIGKAKNSLSVFGKKAETLEMLADYIIERKY